MDRGFLFLIGWPTTAAAVALALFAELVVPRLAKQRTRRRTHVSLGLWGLAAAFLLVPQLLLYGMLEDSVALLLKWEEQQACFWAVLAALAFLFARLWWRSRQIHEFAPARLKAWRLASAAIAAAFTYFAVDDAIMFWRDAFTPPLRVQGRVTRLWMKHGMYFDSTRDFQFSPLGARFDGRAHPYATIAGREVHITWDLYRELKRGQVVALEIGAGSGRAIGFSTGQEQ